jgi:hypothetical protein
VLHIALESFLGLDISACALTMAALSTAARRDDMPCYPRALISFALIEAAPHRRQITLRFRI